MRKDLPDRRASLEAQAQPVQQGHKACKVFRARQGRLGRRVRKALWVRRDHRECKVPRALPVFRAFKVRPGLQGRRAWDWFSRERGTQRMAIPLTI